MNNDQLSQSVHWLEKKNSEMTGMSFIKSLVNQHWNGIKQQ